MAQTSAKFRAALEQLQRKLELFEPDQPYSIRQVRAMLRCLLQTGNAECALIELVMGTRDAPGDIKLLDQRAPRLILYQDALKCLPYYALLPRRSRASLRYGVRQGGPASRHPLLIRRVSAWDILSALATSTEPFQVALRRAIGPNVSASTFTALVRNLQEIGLIDEAGHFSDEALDMFVQDVAGEQWCWGPLDEPE